MRDALTCDALFISSRFSEIPFTLRLMELTMSMAFTKLASISSRQRVMFSSTEFMQRTAGCFLIQKAERMPESLGPQSDYGEKERDSSGFGRLFEMSTNSTSRFPLFPP